MDPGSGRFVVARLTSGGRFVACCLIAVTLVLLAIPDEADFQPIMVVGLQSFSDGGDDVDDGDDVSGGHTVVPAIDSAVRGDGMFARGDIREGAVFSDRIRAGRSVSSRGPPNDALGAKRSPPFE